LEAAQKKLALALGPGLLAGRATDVLALFRRDRTVLEKLHGKGSPLETGLLVVLAEKLHAQKHFAEARACYEEALAGTRACFGERHPQTATFLNNMATRLHAQGDDARAQACAGEALTITRDVLGEEHLSTAACSNNLGAILTRAGQ